MARYCFYCGRALAAGEKCSCRSNGRQGRATTGDQGAETGNRANGAGTSAGDPSQSTASAGWSASRPPAGEHATKSAPPQGQGKSADQSNRQDHKSSQSSTSGSSSSASSAAGKKAGAGQSWQARASRTARASLNGDSVRTVLRQLGQYLLHPAESVKRAAQSANRQPILVVLLLQGVAGGLFLLIASRQTIMQALFALNISPLPQSANFLSRFFIIVQGFGISLGASLLVVLLYHAALRYLFRRPVNFHLLLAVMCPSFFFTTIFLLAALATLGVSIFNAAMLVLIGFAIAALLQFLALRHVSGMDENRIITLVVFVLFIFTGIMAMLLNLSLPLLRVLVDQSVTV